MRRKQYLLLSVLCLLALAFKPLQPPIRWPVDLDELVEFIENGERGYVFTPREHGEPYISWSMVHEIMDADKDVHQTSHLIIEAADLARIVAPGGVAFPKEGTLIISEDYLFGLLLQTVIRGQVCACGDEDGKPILYGSAVQGIFDQLAEMVE